MKPYVYIKTYANVHSSIYNSLKLEQPERWIYEQAVLYPDYGILLSQKKGWNINMFNNMNIKNIMSNERSKENSKKTKDDILHDFIHIIYYRKSKTILINEWLLGGRPQQSIDWKEMRENLLGWWKYSILNCSGYKIVKQLPTFIKLYT